MTLKNIFPCIAFFTMASVSAAAQDKAPVNYPAVPASDIVDDYFGLKVADPYRILEDENSPVTIEWIGRQRANTEDYLSKIPFRDSFRARLTELNNFPKVGTPTKKNDGRYYWFENDGLKGQSILMRSDSLNGAKEIFIDPNTLSDDGTVALTGFTQSRDGKYTAYTISRKGSDWTEIYVLDTESKKLMDDHIVWAKFTVPSWFGDGFFYSAYPPTKEGKEFTGSNEGQKVIYHKIGTPQSQDKLIFEDKANPLHFHDGTVYGKESVIFLTVSGQGVGNELRVKRLDKEGWENAPWTVIEPTQDYEFTPLAVRDGMIYIKTTKNAPRGQVLVAPVDNPTDFRVFIPEQKSVIGNVHFTPDHLITVYSKDASTHAYLHKPDGTFIREIKFPGIGTASFITSEKYPEIYYTYTSYTTPEVTYKYNPETDESTIVNAPEIKGYNPDDYITEQKFYPSADGTMIPMFITHRKGLSLDGTNPTYLYGYGGFNISNNPKFTANRVAWLENGGVFVVANLRGGGEYGEEWHEAGTKLKKMNVFNDFIAAAEFLIKEGYTNPDRLAIEGASNGGLLIGATVNLRPDLFKVAIPRVGVMDMMRYHLFTIGWNWAPDYGTSADSPEMAKYLYSYSPAHNVGKSKKDYPAIMVTTADHDDRVVPAHSFKYAAALQAAETGEQPKIIRIDSNAGHGAGKPVGKVIDEFTDIYSFIFYNMGLTPIYK